MYSLDTRPEDLSQVLKPGPAWDLQTPKSGWGLSMCALPGPPGDRGVLHQDGGRQVWDSVTANAPLLPLLARDLKPHLDVSHGQLLSGVKAQLKSYSPGKPSSARAPLCALTSQVHTSPVRPRGPLRAGPTSCGHFHFREKAAFGQAMREGTNGDSTRGEAAAGSLTCMGLHVLQQVVVELELDPTGATGVGLWGGRGRNEAVLGAEPPRMPWKWEPRHTLGLWAPPARPRH